jgi:tRNA nucleotidyltransferase/poly(A) polymerase
MHAKLVSLEGSQHSLNCEVGGVKEKAKEIEESVAQWLPKYDAAARALDEVQKRLAKLEACGQQRRLLDSEDPFQKLYKDLSAMRRPNEPATRWPLALQYKSNPSGLDARPFLVLESRIEHVASAAYMNFRYVSRPCP